MRQGPYAITVLALAFLSGCSSGRLSESYHFPGTRRGEVVNYYRVDVQGHVCGDKLRYISGFFDESALNRYFDTFAQPENGLLLGETAKAKSEDETSGASSKDEKRDPDPQGKGRKLVLLLSQNSEAIAEQIGAIAQSEALATVVGRTIFGDQLAELESRKLEAGRSHEAASAVATDARLLATRLRGDDEVTDEDATEILLQFINRAAAEIGAPVPFDSFAEAQAWLEKNRTELVGGRP